MLLLQKFQQLGKSIQNYIDSHNDDYVLLRVIVRAQILVAILFLSLAPVSAGTEGRAMTAEIVMQDRIWLSDEVVDVEVYVSGAPYNRNITLNWDLSDTNGIIESGSIIFQMAGSTQIIPLNFSAYYSGENFYELEIEVSVDANIVTDVMPFTVLRKSILPTISNIIVFGDSLSDMGNAKDSILNVPDVPPYWEGRFSNGEVWIEHVSDRFGINTTHGSGISQGDNRAFGGSQTGQGYSYLLLPNTGTQINNYLTNVQSNISSSELIFLWAGGNDFLYGTGNPDVISQNMASHVRALALAGGTQFVVANLPPLEVTPEGASRSTQQRATMANDVVAYNNKLAIEMANLSNSMNIEITLIDAWTIFNEIVSKSEHVGITNTQDQACITSGTILPLPICNSGDTVVSNADEYLFFDKAHPTATMHRVIGEFAIEIIGDPDVDGDGIRDIDDQCEWTSDKSTVNVDGCDWSQQDEDGDNVSNGADECLETLPGYEVDTNGCADYQRDTDGDGFTDDVDPCPDDPPYNDHDLDGCIDLLDSDDDNDGISDQNDSCPLGVIGIHVHDYDNDGCSDIEDDDDDNDGLLDQEESELGTDPQDVDSDDDGVWDGVDAFPLDPNEYKDSDGDGYGDNSDSFPNDPNEWNDSDYDSVGDNADVFPNDSNEWDDSDGDQIGDNGDECPYVFGDAWYPAGCPDLDGDGYGDEVDKFPSDPGEWSDLDGDNYGDNSDEFPSNPDEWIDSDGDGFGDNSDAFPLNPSEWKDSDLDGCGDNSDQLPLDGTDCFDTDNDGVGDSTDPWPDDPNEWLDSDYDGVGDNSDFAPFDASESYDTDGDGVGDNSDPWPKDSTMKRDSDGDGVADSVDSFPNNPSLDSYVPIIVSLIVISLIVIGVLFLIKRKKIETFDELDNLSPGVPQDAPSFDDWE